jgi:ProP effector
MSQPTNPVKKDKQHVIDWLIEHFPSAFFKKRNEIKPLKIGIFDDIIDFYERLEDPPFSKKSLREALSYYSASPSYLLCQKANAARIDIYGVEVDLVSEEQAKYAHQRYTERYEQKAPQKKKPTTNEKTEVKTQ